MDTRYWVYCHVCGKRTYDGRASHDCEIFSGQVTDQNTAQRELAEVEEIPEM